MNKKDLTYLPNEPLVPVNPKWTYVYPDWVYPEMVWRLPAFQKRWLPYEF